MISLRREIRGPGTTPIQRRVSGRDDGLDLAQVHRFLLAHPEISAPGSRRNLGELFVVEQSLLEAETRLKKNPHAAPVFLPALLLEKRPSPDKGRRPRSLTEEETTRLDRLLDVDVRRLRDAKAAERLGLSRHIISDVRRHLKHIGSVLYDPDPKAWGRTLRTIFERVVRDDPAFHGLSEYHQVRFASDSLYHAEAGYPEQGIPVSGRWPPPPKEWGAYWGMFIGQWFQRTYFDPLVVRGKIDQSLSREIVRLLIKKTATEYAVEKR